MKFKFVVGVDVSKEWFNWAVLTQQYECVHEGEEPNTVDSLEKFIDELLTKLKLQDLSEVVLVMEHTGIYCNHLASVWSNRGGDFSVVPAADISENLAGRIGWDHKTDMIDARRIGQYGIRFQDRLVLSELRSSTYTKLRKLRSMRERFIKAKNLLVVPLQEDANFESAALVSELTELQAEPVAALKLAIAKVEKQIAELVRADEQLNRYFKQMTSVPGIGPVIALEVLVATEGFTLFTPSQSSQFKRYSRAAPMPRQSGKKKGRRRTSKRGSKKLNSLFNMGAMSLLSSKGELTDYYHRKIKEGKHHLCVINAMKAKLIDRLFAVVRNDTMYQNKLQVN